MNIVNLLDSSKLVDTLFGPNYHGREQDISRGFGAKNLGFHLEVMNPKTFSCPYHFHTGEEELFIVLEGEAIVRQNNEFRKVKAGDLIYYGTGAESAHQMYNHTEKPFRFFALSTNSDDESCHYPDSNKVLDRKAKLLTQNGVKVDYFKDEEDPSVYWPAHALRGDVP